MSTNTLYHSFHQAKKSGQKKFVVLIDPDKVRLGNMDKVLDLAIQAKVDYFFIGGSLIVNNMLDKCLQSIRDQCNIPMILFPGNSYQLTYKADGVLFLSLISGRNAELLIGSHVVAAPYLKLSPLEILPTGYMLIDGGIPTAVQYISNTRPIPYVKDDIAVCTAMAGEMLGLRLIFMDAGSGAHTPISEDMIEAVSGAIDIPLIIGGGIRTPEKALANAKAGADVIVVGNAIEKDPNLIIEMSEAVHSVNPKEDLSIETTQILEPNN
ncbi:MAG: geranylgeranylglyceryl/heptaprenylglyceryl phosphate synthase [Bacteroidetes bacterium]|nr:geranylgeranylglyceryl/heptaprenylglyceryl phosphate synthase [Bacteroidota bacterium]